MADPFQDNINGVISLVNSRINKTSNSPLTSSNEGVIGEKIDEFELKMSDDELILLAKKWEMLYAPYEAKLRIRQRENMQFYLGRQKEGTAVATEEGKGISANFIFEAVETFIPAALSKNPEPVVWSDNTPNGNAIADAVTTMLQYHSDALGMRAKLSDGVRKWSVDFLGVWKYGWDNKISDIKFEVRDAKNFIFDPAGYVNVHGEFVGYLGERITVSAERLIEMFPKFKSFIEVVTDGKLGTPCAYTEWWTDEYCFYTFKNKVLDKNKNPHFNYDQENEIPNETDNELEQQEPEIEVIKGKNHFAAPLKPYTFLSVFSMQNQPHDVTGLIEQNIPNQRLISRRVEQIDYNISRSNNSRVFSGSNFTQETAKQAAVAMQKGHPVIAPAGLPIKDAIADFPAEALPAGFFTDLENNIENLRSIFGTAGITASNQNDDETARGMILKQQYDNSRIGGGIGDAIEGVAKNAFNWFTQMYYVYYDEPHFASIMGQMQATEYIELSAQNLTAHLIVSVAPDSMKPHDQITEMNQAMSLWEAKALDIKTLLTRLNFPNPQETAAQVWLYQTNPQLYGQLNFPDLTAQIQQLMASQPLQGSPQDGSVPSGAGQVPAPAPSSTGGVDASAALSSVPLPK